MILTYGIIAVILVIAELCYFKIADHFNIIDKPNERSSHSTIVLRGGGVIFAISMLVWAIFMAVQGVQGVQEFKAEVPQGSREREFKKFKSLRVRGFKAPKGQSSNCSKVQGLNSLELFELLKHLEQFH